MEEIIKNCLYYISLGAGSIILICLLVAGIIKSFCFMLDHLKIGKFLVTKIIPLYLKQKEEETMEKAKLNCVKFNSKEE